MACDIALIISSHADSEWLANFHDLRFQYVPASAADKRAAEQIQLRLLCDHEVNSVVLARYRQISVHRLIPTYPHGIVAALIGATPYHRSYERV
jgi:formyltetrahydrofolate deformylase